MLACFTVTPLTQDASFVGLQLDLDHRDRRGQPGTATCRVGQRAVLSRPDRDLAGLLPRPQPHAQLRRPVRSARRWFEHYPALWAAGIEHMRTQASPMEPDNGVKLIFVTVIGMIMIMTDLLVSGVGRPAWAIAPPATLFLVPALGLGTDTGVMSFCYIAVGYLAILIAEGLNSDGAMDSRAFSGLGGGLRHADTGGLASRRLSRGSGHHRDHRARVCLAHLVLARNRFRQRSRWQRSAAADRSHPWICAAISTSQRIARSSSTRPPLRAGSICAWRRCPS